MWGGVWWWDVLPYNNNQAAGTKKTRKSQQERKVRVSASIFLLSGAHQKRGGARKSYPRTQPPVLHSKPSPKDRPQCSIQRVGYQRRVLSHTPTATLSAKQQQEELSRRREPPRRRCGQGPAVPRGSRSFRRSPSSPPPANRESKGCHKEVHNTLRGRDQIVVVPCSASATQRMRAGS